MHSAVGREAPIWVYVYSAVSGVVWVQGAVQLIGGHRCPVACLGAAPGCAAPVAAACRSFGSQLLRSGQPQDRGFRCLAQGFELQ